MTRLRSTLAVLLLPVLAGCTASYESQCDHLSELDDQVACLDTAFVQLRIGNTEAPEREGLRGDRQDCTDGEFATRGEDRYICDDGEWRSMDELDEDEDSEADEDDRDDEWDEDDLDDRDDEWDEDDLDDRDDEWDEEDAERSEAGEDFCTELEERGEDFERCRSAVRGLDELHERTREATRRNTNSGERRRLIRNALREGRENVRDELGRARGERERSRGEEDRAP